MRLAPTLTRPINWHAWVASGAIIPPAHAKAVNWPGLTLGGLIILAAVSWAVWP